MLEWILKYWIEVGFGIICGLVVYAVKSVKKIATDTKNTQDFMRKGISILLWKSLHDIYTSCMAQGWISVEDLKIVESIYEQYHSLGGNGVGTKMYTELADLPSTPKES